jgi:hypothetical protein
LADISSPDEGSSDMISVDGYVIECKLTVFLTDEQMAVDRRGRRKWTNRRR